MSNNSSQSTVRTVPKGPGYVIDTSGKTGATQFREAARFSKASTQAQSNATASAIQTMFVALRSRFDPEQSITMACHGRGVGEVMKNGAVQITVWTKEQEEK
jgi:hypothetical protein